MRFRDANMVILFDMFSPFLDIEPISLCILVDCFCDWIRRCVVAQMVRTLPMAILIFKLVLTSKTRRLTTINIRTEIVEIWHVDIGWFPSSSNRAGSIKIFSLWTCQLRIGVRHLRLDNQTVTVLNTFR
jgi:hypothetical protein